MRFRFVAALSLVFTYLFFFEYLPPARWVDIPHDLQYFHYPLDDFAFQSLRQGKIPEWDPSMYCGITFAGNSQSALFYPPMWLVFLANAGNARLKYRSLEVLLLAHVWLAFLFAFLWLRGRRLCHRAAAFGAGIFAFSGYLCLQISHFGLACGYAWLPLGLWSIDQAAGSRDPRPLSKLAVASALCFLAGHPPTWFVFCVCMLVYAACQPTARAKLTVWTACALAFSCLLAMVQMLPTWEASALKEAHENYGSGIRDLKFYVSYLVPNFFDFSISTPGFTNLGYEYLYLGAPAFAGLLWLLFHYRKMSGALPLIAVGIASLILVTNPFDLVWAVVSRSVLLAQVCRSWNFLGGVTLAVAGLAAVGLDDFFRRRYREAPRWLAGAAVILLAAWSAWILRSWLPGGPGFAIGWHGALEPVVMFALFSLGLWASHRRPWVLAALLLATGVDYKVFGSSKRFNANTGNVDRMFSRASLPGMNEQVYRELREHNDFRIVLDTEDPPPMELRHHGLSTPQGGDPLVPAQYGRVLRPEHAYYDLLRVDPSNTSLLRLLAVRYVLTTEGQPLYPRMLADRNFRTVNPVDGYFRVFEFNDPQPPYRWESAGPRDWIRKIDWSAERREFEVQSENGGRFILIEEYYPGWQVRVDGRSLEPQLWNQAFQSIAIPEGKHRVEFLFRSTTLRIGAGISGLALLGLLVLGGWNTRSRK